MIDLRALFTVGMVEASIRYGAYLCRNEQYAQVCIQPRAAIVDVAS